MPDDAEMGDWSERASRILDEVSQSSAFALIDREDPWGATSLDATEQRMLDRWASLDALPADLKAQYEAFLGEGIRRRFGGSWVRLDPAMLGRPGDDAPFGLGITSPNTDGIDVVSSFLPQAYRVRTGTWWSSVFQVAGHWAA